MQFLFGKSAPTRAINATAFCRHCLGLKGRDASDTSLSMAAGCRQHGTTMQGAAQGVWLPSRSSRGSDRAAITPSCLPHLPRADCAAGRLHLHLLSSCLSLPTAQPPAPTWIPPNPAHTLGRSAGTGLPLQEHHTRPASSRYSHCKARAPSCGCSEFLCTSSRLAVRRLRLPGRECCGALICTHLPSTPRCPSASTQSAACPPPLASRGSRATSPQPQAARGPPQGLLLCWLPPPAHGGCTRNISTLQLSDMHLPLGEGRSGREIPTLYMQRCSALQEEPLSLHCPGDLPSGKAELLHSNSGLSPGCSGGLVGRKGVGGYNTPSH